MKNKVINGIDTKVKRQSKSLRTHIRRMKQAERKGAMPIRIKKVNIIVDR